MDVRTETSARQNWSRWTETRSARSPAREELNLKTIVNLDTIKANRDSRILSSDLRD